jgi:uncharacterized DUF497 family protein
VHTDGEVEYRWDPLKAAANLRKHGVRFADAALSLEDPLVRCIPDSDSVEEERFICLGSDPSGRLLVTVFAPVGRVVRIISSRIASRTERYAYESRT